MLARVFELLPACQWEDLLMRLFLVESWLDRCAPDCTCAFLVAALCPAPVSAQPCHCQSSAGLSAPGASPGISPPSIKSWSVSYWTCWVNDLIRGNQGPLHSCRLYSSRNREQLFNNRSGHLCRRLTACKHYHKHLVYIYIYVLVMTSI